MLCWRRCGGMLGFGWPMTSPFKSWPSLTIAAAFRSELWHRHADRDGRNRPSLFPFGTAHTTGAGANASKASTAPICAAFRKNRWWISALPVIVGKRRLDRGGSRLPRSMPLGDKWLRTPATDAREVSKSDNEKRIVRCPPDPTSSHRPIWHLSSLGRGHARPRRRGLCRPRLPSGLRIGGCRRSYAPRIPRLASGC
jgi:hypothetical protein